MESTSCKMELNIALDIWTWGWRVNIKQDNGINWMESTSCKMELNIALDTWTWGWRVNLKQDVGINWMESTCCKMEMNIACTFQLYEGLLRIIYSHIVLMKTIVLVKIICRHVAGS